MERIPSECTDFIETKEPNCRIMKSHKDELNSKITIVTKNVLNTFSGTLITLHLISSSFCILREDVSRSYLMSAILVGAGICTLLLTLCSKKFVIAGSNRLGYLVCLLMLFETKHCEGNGDLYAMGPELRTTEWRQRLNDLQGAVMITCMVQLFIGFIDMRFLINHIRPVSIASTLIFTGVFFINTSAMRMAGTSWTIFILTIGIMLALYFIASNCSNSDSGRNYKILHLRNKLYIGFFGVMLMWCLCAVLSYFELIWIQSAARTDVFNGIYDYASKIRISFPFRWGVPEWKSQSIFLMLPAAFITVFEVIYTFYNDKKDDENAENVLSNASMLIKLEAILCFAMNSMGVVVGLNVNVRKDSRKILDICSALILIAMGILEPLCAFFTTIPEPIAAALIFSIFISAILEGFNMLKVVDFRSTKNIYTLAISFFMAFTIPTLIREDLQITNWPAMDNILRCWLSTNFVVAGLTAVLFDNLFKAFLEEPIANEYGKSEKRHISDREESPANIAESDLCDCCSPFFA